MDSVLAAFDLSLMGRRVADRARIVAETHKATLTLVHVGEVPDVELPADMLERIRLYRHSKAEDLLAWINSRAGCPVTLKVVSRKRWRGAGPDVQESGPSRHGNFVG